MNKIIDAATLFICNKRAISTACYFYMHFFVHAILFSCAYIYIYLQAVIMSILYI